MVQRYKRAVKFEDRLKRLYHDVKSIIRLLGLDTNHQQGSYDTGGDNKNETKLIATSNVKYVASRNGADTSSYATDKINSTKDYAM